MDIFPEKLFGRITTATKPDNFHEVKWFYYNQGLLSQVAYNSYRSIPAYSSEKRKHIITQCYIYVSAWNMSHFTFHRKLLLLLRYALCSGHYDFYCKNIIRPVVLLKDPFNKHLLEQNYGDYMYIWLSKYYKEIPNFRGQFLLQNIVFIKSPFTVQNLTGVFFCYM